MTDITSQIQLAIDAINGAATFDEKEIIDETVTETTYLILPDSFTHGVDNDDGVAKPRRMDPLEIITIAYMNFVHLVTNGMSREKAIKVAMARAGIVANGGYYPTGSDSTKTMYTYRAEIRFQKRPIIARYTSVTYQRGTEAPVTEDLTDDLTKTLRSEGLKYRLTGLEFNLPDGFGDFTTLIQTIPKDTLTKMIKYLPILAHMAFTKFEHHYIDNAYFKESYAKQFRSLKMTLEEPMWNHADVIYPAIHWMGPYAMRIWCKNLITEKLMPRPLGIKFPLIPAGTALICSTVAVLKAAGAIPGFNAFYEVYGIQWANMLAAVEKIRTTPYRYHTRSDLFGETNAEAELNPAKDAAAQLAPAAQAFINRYAQGTDLARIQAIKKHAEANLGLMRRYETIFSGNAVQARTAARIRPMRDLIEGTMSTPTNVTVPLDDAQ